MRSLGLSKILINKAKFNFDGLIPKEPNQRSRNLAVREKQQNRHAISSKYCA